MKRLFLSLLVLLSPACARDVPNAPPRSEALRPERLPTSVVRADAEAGCVTGEIGPGASYTLCVPDNWNGDLVLYAHGYTATVFPLGPPPTESPEALRDLVLAKGCAFGFSTYSQNGYAVKDGAIRTRQLLELFESRYGPPEHTYLLGYSLGGLVAIKLLEQQPGLFSGALTVSGIVGGTKAETEYLGNVWVLFQYFYPGVVRWGLFDPPPANALSVLTDSVVAAIIANPQGAVALSQITQPPVPFADGTELGQSIVQALVLQAIALEDLLGRTHDQPFFDNSQTVYTGNLPSELLADINARVTRYSATPASLAWLRREYEPTGRITVPVLTLHDRRDPVVPYFHETLFAQRVAEAGASDLLVQRPIDAYGHPVTIDKVDTALGDLKNWVVNGTPPVP